MSQRFSDDLSNCHAMVNALNGEVLNYTDNISYNIEILTYSGQNTLTDVIEKYIVIFLKKVELNNLHSVLSECFRFIEKQIKVLKPVEIVYLEILVNNPSVLLEDITSFIPKQYEWVSTKVSKRLEQEKAVHSERHNINWRALNETDSDHLVIECIKQAHLNGLEPPLKINLSRDEFLDRVTDAYTPLVTEKRKSIVASHNLEFCGHATYEYIYKVSGVDINLIDVFVTTKFQNMGVAKLLTKEVESRGEKAGAEFILGSVEEKPAIMKKILSNLKQDGWNTDALIFCRGERYER